MDPESVNEIIKGLYLGDLKAATNNELMTNLNITHVISLDVSQPIISVSPSNLFIQVSDEPHSDLLSHLPTCVDSIHHCLSLGSSVLVHCRHGVSRSTTVVVAYLMKTLQQDRDTALQTVRESRPCVDPNSGFMDQLRLFGEMGCRLDLHNVKYKLYQLEKCGWEFTSGGQGDAYKCRQCRVVLVCQTDVLPHKEGRGPDWRTGVTGAVCVRALFVAPKDWMESQVVGAGGRLLCGKCKAKLGAWATAGEGVRCPCGAWLARGFLINLNKVDLSRYCEMCYQNTSNRIAHEKSRHPDLYVKRAKSEFAGVPIRKRQTIIS